jgi:transposase
MPQSGMLDVGLDGHHESLAVAYLGQDHGAPVVSLGTIGPRQCDLDKRLRQLHAKATPLVCVSEAGPCGYGLDRDLTKRGHDCWGVAPSLLPKKAGARGKTDRRDARHLARLRRSGELTSVDVPQVDDEARRARSRAREARIRELTAAKSRLKALLRRQDMRSTGQAHWRPAHLRGRAAVVCPTPAQQRGFQEEVRAGTEPTARLQRLAQARQERVKTWRLAPGVAALQAWRGGQFTVAVTPVAARGDLPRVPNPKQLRSALGLTPSEYASGPRRAQGGITQTGTRHARRALGEGAWAYRYAAKGSRHLQRRLEQLPHPIQDIRWKAQVRLGKRSRHLMARGKNANPVVVALARELVALMGAVARAMTRPASTPYAAYSLPEGEHRGKPVIGRGAAPVWDTPRWRYAAARNPRA